MDSLVPVPQALTWATHVDVLPPDRELSRREGCTVIRSPSNPRHWWGNLLLFDNPPGPGERASWELHFADEFAPDREVQHVTLAWDRTTGELGAAAEFTDAGYTLEETIALVCDPGDLRPHPRADRSVRIRVLDPSPGADLTVWDQVADVQAVRPAGRRGRRAPRARSSSSGWRTCASCSATDGAPGTPRSPATVSWPAAGSWSAAAGPATSQWTRWRLSPAGHLLAARRRGGPSRRRALRCRPAGHLR